MLDIKLIRERPDFVKGELAKRGVDPAEVDRLLEADQKRRKLQAEVDQLRADRKRRSREVGKLPPDQRAAEIDIVAMDGDVLVFVEVKTRRGREAGAPEEAVDERKQKRMRRAAEIFATRYRADDVTMRFDVVAIDASSERLEIELLRNAF